MNKRKYITKETIDNIVTLLDVAIVRFKNGAEGCFNFPLNEDLVLAVGWSSGYDPEDTTIIKSCTNTDCYAVNAAIKVRNDLDCADFDYLNYPVHNDGECWDCGVTLRPDLTWKDLKPIARWFLENFVDIVNAHKKGLVSY